VPGSVDARNISVSDSLNSLDSQVVTLYLPYKNILEKDMNRVISVSEEEMVKDKPESNLTNFLADLLLEQGKKSSQKAGLDFHPDISYFNYGGIRTSLPKGEITVGKIFELMPFENELVFIQLSGKQIQEFLDIIAGKGGDSVGGVRFVISDKKAKDVKIGGSPIDESADYWLATNDYVAGGGDDLLVFTQHSAFVNNGEKIREIIISYMEEQQKNGAKLKAVLDGRIRYE
jgi:2',3'-cyclic-nucleotide 2'-phosphodiesterase (5'-nucleotidase family)